MRAATTEQHACPATLTGTPPNATVGSNAEQRQLGSADPTLSTAAPPVANQSGHGPAVAAVGVMQALGNRSG
jgi:hypothetical protein